MSKVEADPVRMREFRRQFHAFNGQIDDLMRQLDRHLNTLGEYWRDAEFRKFESALKEATQTIKRYQARAQEFDHHLNQKIIPLEKYIGGGTQ